MVSKVDERRTSDKYSLGILLTVHGIDFCHKLVNDLLNNLVGCHFDDGLAEVCESRMEEKVRNYRRQKEFLCGFSIHSTWLIDASGAL